MKITKSQLQKIIKEELLKEAGGLPGRQLGRTMGDLDADAKTRETDFLNTAREEWLPDSIGEHSDLVSQAGQAIGWDIGLAMAFAVAILEDVNAHDMAKKVNSLLLTM